MAMTSELMTDATDASDKESIAVRNFAYAIAYHCKTAELVAVESPDERGRRVFAAIADEYRYLARFLLTSSEKAMKSHYAIKCDLIEKVKKDLETPGKVYAGGDERKARTILGDVRYFLQFHHEYVSAECIQVENLATRRLMTEAASLIEQISNVFRRWELGDLEWFSAAMEDWKTACFVARDNPAISI